MVFILKWQSSQPVIVCLNMYFSRNLRDYWYMGGGAGGCWTNRARWAVERSKLDEITFVLAQLLEFEWSLVSLRHSTKFPELDAKNNHRDCGIKESYWGLTYCHLHEENPLPALFTVWLRNVCYVSWLRASKLLTFGQLRHGVSASISQHAITILTNIKVFVVRSSPERKLNKYKKVFIIVKTNW